MKRLLSLLFFIVACQGCSDSVGNLNWYETITISSDTLPADGLSSTTISITLLGNSQDGQTVTISTDQGHFAGGTGATEQTVSTKTQNLVATATLIAGTAPGIARIGINISGVTIDTSVIFTALTIPTKVILSQDSVVADNQSSVKITVIDSSGQDGQMVTFTSDQGHFAGTSGQTTGTITSKTIHYAATATLIAPGQAAIANIGININGIIFDTIVTFTPPPTPMSVTVSHDSVPADGVSGTLITATFPSTVLDGQSVTFTADQGRFVGSSGGSAGTYPTKTYNHTATAKLIASQQPSFVNVEVTSGQVKIDTSILFTASYPDSLILIPTSSDSVQMGVTPITFNVLYYDTSSIGRMPSNGVKIILSAINSGTGQNASFLYREFFTSQSGSATISLIPSDSGNYRLNCYMAGDPSVYDAASIIIK